ncbi:MAG: hypothetical protein JSR60_09250 [Proteobacteria bacterium]|nr:hypothetical protein [Pseudomonadota bacterium]
MSPQGPTRRMVAIGGSITAALGLAALGLTVPRLLGHRKTPYDDLLNQLTDRDAAIRLGRVSPAVIDKAEMAEALRQRLTHHSLQDVTAADVAAGRIVEVKGWVLPETLVELCSLAASVQ